MVLMVLMVLMVIMVIMVLIIVSDCGNTIHINVGGISAKRFYSKIKIISYGASSIGSEGYRRDTGRNGGIPRIGAVSHHRFIDNVERIGGSGSEHMSSSGLNHIGADIIGIGLLEGHGHNSDIG